VCRNRGEGEGEMTKLKFKPRKAWAIVDNQGMIVSLAFGRLASFTSKKYARALLHDLAIKSWKLQRIKIIADEKS
jgi:hypothetical protein